MEKENRKDSTRILFESEEVVRKRKARTKQFHNANVRSYLLNDEYEMSKVLTDLMVAEGFSDSFIDDLLIKETDEAYAMTLDYLHAAALIMGEDYVRENLLGKEISVAEAGEKIRGHYHEEQLRAYQGLYENLDERIKAALEGETKVDHEIAVLKIQSENAKEMYQQSLKSLKIQHSYELKLKDAEMELEKQRLREEVGKLQGEVEKAKSELSSLEAENADFRKRAGGKKRRIFRMRDKAEEKSCRTNAPGDKSRDTEESKERRIFCYSVLGNKNFTPAQIETLLPALRDEKIPVEVLEKLCAPDLPLDNMKSFIRYIRKDGDQNEG